MALTSRYPSHITIADDPANIIFGTCMIGTSYGQVESATVKRAGDVEELKACGNKLLAAIISNTHFELTLKTLFTADVTPPGLAELIDFPLAGVTGRILPPIDIEWEKAGQRMLSITAKSWDCLSEDGVGAATYAGGPASIF